MKSGRFERTYEGLAAELAGLPALGPERLKERWLSLYHNEPPLRISRDLLIRAIASNSTSGARRAETHNPQAAQARRRRWPVAQLHSGRAPGQARRARGSAASSSRLGIARKIHPSPPASPRFSRSLRKTRK
jgi:hypothetical protein